MLSILVLSQEYGLFSVCFILLFSSQMEEYMALSRKDLFIEISPKEIQLIQSLLTKYNPNLVSVVSCDMKCCSVVVFIMWVVYLCCCNR